MVFDRQDKSVVYWNLMDLIEFGKKKNDSAFIRNKCFRLEKEYSIPGLLKKCYGRLISELLMKL